MVHISSNLNSGCLAMTVVRRCLWTRVKSNVCVHSNIDFQRQLGTRAEEKTNDLATTLTCWKSTSNCIGERNRHYLFSTRECYVQRTVNTMLGSTLASRQFHSLSASASTARSINLSNSHCDVQKRKLSQETYDRWLSPDNPPFSYAQSFMENIHDLTGLPWWASIALTTFTLRTFVTLPFSVYSQYIMTKVELLQPEMKQMSRELSIELARAVKQFGWGEKKAKARFNYSMKKIVREMYIRENCHPFKITVVAWIQLPMWISMSISLRSMSGGWLLGNEQSPVLCPGLLDEGMLWFQDLTVADTSFALPVLLAAVNLCIIEMQTLRPGEVSKLQKYLTNIFRGFSLIMIPIGAIVPSSMCWYWLCSSSVGLMQNIALKYPVVRRCVGLQQTPSESNTPFRDMIQAAKTKYSRKNSTTDR